MDLRFQVRQRRARYPGGSVPAYQARDAAVPDLGVMLAVASAEQAVSATARAQARIGRYAARGTHAERLIAVFDTNAARFGASTPDACCFADPADVHAS